jgi:hypothetical protein
LISTKDRTSRCKVKGILLSKESKLYQTSFWSLLIVAMLANILSQTIHETGHHMVYQVMGRDPVWGFTKLVQLWQAPPAHPDQWVEIGGEEGERGWLRLSSLAESKAEDVIATAAGPLAGLLGAVLGLVVSRSGRDPAFRQMGLALALSASLVAVLYYGRSAMRTSRDEANIAAQLGVARALIEVPLGLAFATCLVFGLRELASWRARLKWLGAVLLGSVATGIPMALADPLVISQVDAGHPLFRPILGYSLPVVLANGLALTGLWIWYRWQQRMR